MKEFRVEEDILEKLDESYDMLFLCNPNNPTGFLIEPQLLARIMEKCRRCGIFLMIDECFLDFVEHGDLYSMKAGLPDNPEFFILKAFTKRYAMAGIRLGYGFMRQSETAGEDGKDDTALECLHSGTGSRLCGVERDGICKNGTAACK